MKSALRSIVKLVLTGIFTFFCVSGSLSQTKTLTILHTNDIHAAFIPHEAFWIKSNPKPMVGGFQELWWMVDSIRKAKRSVLILDAGDVMTGTPISEIEYQGSAGGALFEMMNMVGYDAWTIGNHDFDISQENLRQHSAMIHFATVSANLVDTLNHFPFNNKEFVIIERNGVRIGIIGLITTDLFHVTNTNNLRGVKVLPPVEVTQRIIDKIHNETDLLVALTHQGVDEDSLLAVGTHGLQVIIGGHSHTRLKTPKVVNGVIICQTGSSCENLGELELTIENNTVTKFDGKLLPLWSHDNRPANDVSKFIDGFKTKVDNEYGVVLGTLVSDWKRIAKGENNIGDFVADAMRDGAHADIAITNSSGIRKDMSAGPIKKLDLFEIMPFRNTLCVLTMSGKEVKDFAQRYAKSLMDGTVSTQVSGIRCQWKRGADGAVVQQVTINGKELDENTSYTCATSDFVVNQGDKYLGFVPRKVLYSDATVFQALVSKVIKEKTIDSKIENRFQEVQ